MEYCIVRDGACVCVCVFVQESVCSPEPGLLGDDVAGVCVCVCVCVCVRAVSLCIPLFVDT